MGIDFKYLGQQLTKAGLTGKAVNEYSKEEVETLVQSVLDSIVPPKEGPFKPPYIDEQGILHIGDNTDPKYHWWRKSGQSIAETLRELNAPDEVYFKYIKGAVEDAPF